MISMVKGMTLSQCEQALKDTNERIAVIADKYDMDAEEVACMVMPVQMAAYFLHLIRHVNIHSMADAIADCTRCEQQARSNNDH